MAHYRLACVIVIVKALRKLQMVQNAAARLITGIKKREHITPVMMELHWLPVESRILFKVLLVIFKCLHGKGPEYLSDMLVPYVPPRNLRSAYEQKLNVPECHYADTRNRAFSIRGPYEWNKLPLEIKNCATVNTFKKCLKTHLFKLAYF